jgi:hypothetical protein
VLYPHLDLTNSFQGIIFWALLASHSSNVREGVELQEQISFEEIASLHTLLSFEGIVF